MEHEGVAHGLAGIGGGDEGEGIDAGAGDVEGALAGGGGAGGQETMGNTLMLQFPIP